MLMHKIKELVQSVNRTVADDSPVPVVPECDIYAQKFMDELVKLEHQLHGSGDPDKIAIGALKSGCEFYDAEWCGILDANLEVGVFTPYWWYTPVANDQTTELFREFEFVEGFPRWVDAVKNNYPIVVPDVEQIKLTQPEEYESYRRLEVTSVIGAPYMKRSVGFVAIKNPKRFQDRPEFLQMLSYVVVVEINERKLIESVNPGLSAQFANSDTGIRINLFGGLEIITANRKMDEADLKSPKGCRLLAYLLLNQRRTLPTLEIAEHLWPEEDKDNTAGNIRALLYRLRQKTECISEKSLIVTTQNGYQINQELDIKTDFQMFEEYCAAAKKVNGSVPKIELLEKAVLLYKGTIFPSASMEQWHIPYENHYRILYVKALNELLGLLHLEEQYSKLYQYSAIGLNMDPSNLDFWYWNLLALWQTGSVSMSRREWETAKSALSADEFEMLERRLSQK